MNDTQSNNNSLMSNFSRGVFPLKAKNKNAWGGGLGQDSLLGMASASTLFFSEAMQGRSFSQPPHMMDYYPSGQRSSRTDDITSQVLAQLADDSLFDPPSEDIFDMEPVPLPSQEQNRLSLLEDTLNQVLNIDNVFMDEEPVPIQSRPLQTHQLAAVPTFTPSASASTSNLKLKRQVEQSPAMMMPPANKRQRTMDEEETDETGRRFRPYQAEQWSEKFEELLQFRKLRGHCCVPHTFDENPSLARWVKRQRYQYKLKAEGKPSTMTDERIIALEQSGFVWDSHGAAWLERWQELVEFEQQHGHANVPSNHPEKPQLATWVKCQRRQYKLFWDGKSSNMNLERIQRLEQVGFEWELRASHKKSSNGSDTSKSGAFQF